MVDDKPIGFFGNEKKGTQGQNERLSYKPSYNPVNPDEPKKMKSKVINKSEKTDKRKTLRVLEDQYLEFGALLDVSEHNYFYELFGELINLGVKNLDSSQLRMYNNALEMQKMKARKNKKV